jgi:hypothetical protein
LKENKLLTAVAEDKTALIEQDRKEAAIASAREAWRLIWTMPGAFLGRLVST